MLGLQGTCRPSWPKQSTAASQVVVKLPADKFGDWEKTKFAPEAPTGIGYRALGPQGAGSLIRADQEAFLGKLKGIEGISIVETQTYTLEEASACEARSSDCVLKFLVCFPH